MSSNLLSIIAYHSKQEKNRCGYCGGPNTSYSHGMSTQLLTVQHYQNLIDRGWRRSGCYCYKPMMSQTCCPHYTIKCESLDFKITKSQKKILKRMIKFLKNELTKDEHKSNVIMCDEDIVRNIEIPDYSKYVESTEKNALKMQVTSVSEELGNRLGSSISNNESRTGTSNQSNENFANLSKQPMETTTTEATRRNFDPTKEPQKKAKLLRIERKQNKLLAQGKTEEEIKNIMNKNKSQNTGKTLEDLFTEINNCSNKLEMRLVRVMSDEFTNTLDKSVKLFKTYQMAIHKEKPKDCDKRSFFNFLVKNPLQEWIPEDGPPHGYGAFHEQYWLNGALIAVAVIDILPYCLSSVYFFYDPSYSHLSLGTFSSLREIFLTRQLNKYASNLKYYYMGFYIHSCTKMRYKARMQPSKLLCPETYIWCDVDKCLPKLDISKYSRLNEDSSAIDEDGIVDIQQVLVLYHNKAMAYGVYRYVQNKLIDDEIKEYASLIGKKCALNMLYYID
ncbi:PREDICTED: arginyl-tRNA--protein transferase 1 isoform X2 [Ceratosolen solmsi marchali]|uniref:Arginyl-tRNA--protein transferase 1 n=1 Tax=Ceratosolen solmsi marchali TaxID=326594 RepID=A0AAJ6YG68_9HYME|nr:PREDICTED: arginyl-tRNA--protein transferase 1 isoform X2 [Ceratosolen solmsi marchali]